LQRDPARQANHGGARRHLHQPVEFSIHSLVLAMLCERVAPNLEKQAGLAAAESLRFRVRRLVDAFNGPFGKIVAGLIAEGQSEPAVLQDSLTAGLVSLPRNATTPICSEARKQASCGRSQNQNW
jgi:hypothetical protein